jgi:hypothetical protein
MSSGRNSSSTYSSENARCVTARSDYLTKPLDISRLQDVLDRFMNPDAARKSGLTTELSSESQRKAG